MAKFVPPEKLTFRFLPEPALVPWDVGALELRYYPYANSAYLRTKENLRRKWLEENAAIRKSHDRKMAAINKVVQQSRKVGCHITESDWQPTCIDWSAYTSDMTELPSKPCGPLMREIVITVDKG